MESKLDVIARDLESIRTNRMEDWLLAIGKEVRRYAEESGDPTVLTLVDQFDRIADLKWAAQGTMMRYSAARKLLVKAVDRLRVLELQEVA